jgi:hypothetical protein
MKCIRLKDEGIDICVTIDVKAIFMQKAGGDVVEELERLETARVLKHIGAGHEVPLAREIAREFKERRALEKE